MARFSGKVGYGVTQQIPEGSGIWKDVITEKQHYGDIVRNVRKMDVDGDLNNDISVSNSISIVADAFANEHFFAIRYVEWAGTRWTVTDVEVERPRLLLRLGGVYNGPTP